MKIGNPQKRRHPFRLGAIRTTDGKRFIDLEKAEKHQHKLDKEESVKTKQPCNESAPGY
jgi:hypothetical protein